ncbi:hypothetical protein BO86DRAFT_399592 [Aspergillus japonicus CBS 114.51]|uniref:Uncharacterized protein n=1 Tax=Aspergillus japonicus CBS 114.51 TaxID=1448312 RepID=A0A8T8X0U3_ASPJA|nr:hypothetical protein BO86DRAFT_399592 [Aspergillus japonicus CBS 114.51]RAH81756.1 hypothetical protein BO86DRAFT_399592 [Aspergillus japonicus CBS 114.51]
MFIVPGTNGQWRSTDCSKQLTQFGEVEFAAAYTDMRCGVFIELKDPRPLTQDWATAVQILQDQWQSFCKRPEYRDQLLFGVLGTEDICRFEFGKVKDDDVEALNAFGLKFQIGLETYRFGV